MHKRFAELACWLTKDMLFIQRERERERETERERERCVDRETILFLISDLKIVRGMKFQVIFS